MSVYQPGPRFWLGFPFQRIDIIGEQFGSVLGSLILRMFTGFFGGREIWVMRGDELEELVWPEFFGAFSKSEALVGGDDPRGDGFWGDAGLETRGAGDRLGVALLLFETALGSRARSSTFCFGLSAGDPESGAGFDTVALLSTVILGVSLERSF
jgi:hypothetical protein